MKYFININQYVLSKSRLDLVEASILEYLRDICSSTSIKVEKYRENGYTWVSIPSLIEQMPMLRIRNRGSIRIRLNHLEEDGWIKRMYSRDSKMLIKLTEKVDKVKSSKAYEEVSNIVK